jgi:hypothetical protein
VTLFTSCAFQAIFGHGGGNHGFLANLGLYPATGHGAAVMIISNQGWALIEELFHSIERESMAGLRWHSPQLRGQSLRTLEEPIVMMLAGCFELSKPSKNSCSGLAIKNPSV